MEPVDPAKRQCTAHKRDGSPCRKYPMRGTNVCRLHGGAAPQVRRAAMERLLAALDPAAAELARLAVKSESEAVRVRAITELMDRAGLPREERHEHTGPDGGGIVVKLWQPKRKDKGADGGD